MNLKDIDKKLMGDFTFLQEQGYDVVTVTEGMSGEDKYIDRQN